MLHVMPFVNYINHGFYSYHPNLFHALAGANGYRIVAIGLGNRRGYGAVAVPEPKVEAFTPYFRGEKSVELRTLLAKPKLPGRAPGGRIKYWGRRILESAKPGVRFGVSIDGLQKIQTNVLVFAVLRKMKDNPFRVPIQGIYADAISDAELRTDYEPAQASTAAQ